MRATYSASDVIRTSSLGGRRPTECARNCAQTRSETGHPPANANHEANKNGPEIIDFRPVLGSLAALANRCVRNQGARMCPVAELVPGSHRNRCLGYSVGSSMILGIALIGRAVGGLRKLKIFPGRNGTENDRCVLYWEARVRRGIGTGGGSSAKSP
jgi:hypothetical protein